MSGYLLDTNVVSENRKKDCNANVRDWVSGQKPGDLFISTVTFAEIRYGASLLSDPDFRHDIMFWLDHTLRPWFAGRILELNEDVILRWRQMVQKGREQNHTFSQPDLFIAAMADLHGLCVVTRNVKDFEKAGVAVLNPWEKTS